MNQYFGKIIKVYLFLLFKFLTEFYNICSINFSRGVNGLRRLLTNYSLTRLYCNICRSVVADIETASATIVDVHRATSYSEFCDASTDSVGSLGFEIHVSHLTGTTNRAFFVGVTLTVTINKSVFCAWTDVEFGATTVVDPDLAVVETETTSQDTVRIGILLNHLKIK